VQIASPLCGERHAGARNAGSHLNETKSDSQLASLSLIHERAHVVVITIMAYHDESLVFRLSTTL